MARRRDHASSRCRRRFRPRSGRAPCRPMPPRRRIRPRHAHIRRSDQLGPRRTVDAVVDPCAGAIHPRLARTSVPRVPFPRAAALSLTTLAVHPLLALQVLLFCLLATALSQAPILRRAGAAALLCLLFAALCQAIGIFAAESFTGHRALGSFGFSPWGMIMGEPDSLRELYHARGPGIEQDAWLGWGCVFLLAAGLAFPPRFRIPRGYAALIWVTVVLAIIAVSPWVRFGGRILDLTFLVPDSIFDLYAIHRATVRLAWPLVILLSLLALVHFVLAWPGRRAVPLLAIAFALQFYSAWPYWAYEYRDARVAVTRLAPPPTILESGSRLLVVEEAGEASIGTTHLRYAMQLAVESGLPLDAGWFARPPPSDTNLSSTNLDPPHEAGARYLAAATGPANLPKRLPQVSGTVVCVQWEILLVCRYAPQPPGPERPSPSLSSTLSLCFHRFSPPPPHSNSSACRCLSDVGREGVPESGSADAI